MSLAYLQITTKTPIHINNRDPLATSEVKFVQADKDKISIEMT